MTQFVEPIPHLSRFRASVVGHTLVFGHKGFWMIQQNTRKIQVTPVTEIARLKEEIQQLKSHNSVLFESWQEAESRAASSSRRAIDLMRQLTFQDVEIAQLRQQLVEATQHLNPPVAA